MKHVRTTRAVLAVLGAALVIGCIAQSEVIARAGVKDVSTDETSTRARELWEKAVTAKGGRERLRKITNLFVDADQGRGYRQSTFFVFPTYRYDFSYDPKREVTAVEVSNARQEIVWWQIDGNEARPRKYIDEDVYRNLLPQFIYLMVTSELDPVPLRVRKEWIGLKRVDVIETDANGWRVDYYLDPKTYLPVRVALPLGPRSRAQGELDHIVTLEDYAAVDGVMMPHTVTHSYTFNSKKLKDRLKFELNPAYDPQIFEQTPSPKMGADAWRSKT